MAGYIIVIKQLSARRFENEKGVKLSFPEPWQHVILCDTIVYLAYYDDTLVENSGMPCPFCGDRHCDDEEHEHLFDMLLSDYSFTLKIWE